MSVVEGRADIKDLLLEVYFNQNQARRQTFGVGGGQFSGTKRMRTGGPGSYKKSSTSIEKAQLSVALQHWLCRPPFQAARISRKLIGKAHLCQLPEKCAYSLHLMRASFGGVVFTDEVAVLVRGAA